MRNVTSKKKTLFDHGNFVAWDGEGVTENGRHKYILLMNSLGDVAYNPNGLTTEECFKILLDSIRPYQIHVCFASGYDCNMMLRSLPKKRLKILWEEGAVQWKRYTIRYRKAKHLWISDGERSLTLWDVFGFFQKSFVKALNEYFPEEKDNEEIQVIVRMKKSRSQFLASDIDAIKYYCALELKWLVKTMDRLRGYVRQVDLRLSRWDGAGALAASILSREKVKEHMNQNIDSCRLALEAYYGGRIETTCIGAYKGKVYHYDINSAYPSVMLDLPPLTNGYFVRQSVPGVNTLFSLHDIEWKFDDKSLPFYPLPYRSSNGSITFPPSGRGMYYGIEADKALQFISRNRGQAIIHASYNFVARNGIAAKPFSFVPRIYDARQKLKSEMQGAEMVFKLGLNSLYGKFQQQLGGTIDKFPSFFQPEWSGYITAATRAKLLDVAMQSPESIVMFATDGIFSVAPLKVKASKKLGEWDAKCHDGIIVVQPGVYYILDGKHFTVRCRGFDLETLKDHRKILTAWKNDKESIAIPTTRFVTLGSALASTELYYEWCQWRTADRELDLTGHSVKRFGTKELKRAAKDLVPLYAREPEDYVYLGLRSHAFATLWNQNENLEEEYVDNIPIQIWLHETTTEEYMG